MPFTDAESRARAVQTVAERQAAHDSAVLEIIRTHRTAGKTFDAIAAELDAAGIEPPGARNARGVLIRRGIRWRGRAVGRIAKRHGIAAAPLAWFAIMPDGSREPLDCRTRTGGDFRLVLDGIRQAAREIQARGLNADGDVRLERAYDGLTVAAVTPRGDVVLLADD